MTVRTQPAQWLTATLLVLASVLVLVPQAQATVPAGNGALLVFGLSRSKCPKGVSPDSALRPRPVARLAGDTAEPSCTDLFGVFRAGPGSRAARLVDDRWSIYGGDVSLSPSGTRIAFARNFLGSGGVDRRALAVAALRRGARAHWLGERAVTPRDSTVVNPSWSPDGARLAYEQTEAESGSTTNGPPLIRVIRRDGGRGRTLTVGCRPAWSAHDLIAFYRSYDYHSSCMDNSEYSPLRRAGIFVIRPDGTGLRQIVRDTLLPVGPTPVHPLSWSPDGRSLAFTAEDRSPRANSASWLYRVAANGTGLRRIAETRSKSGIYQPVWSPDGRRIAFSFPNPDIQYGDPANTYVIPSNPPVSLPPTRWRTVVANAVPLAWETQR